MTTSKITRLVRYVTLFGNIDWLPRDEAEQMLKKEQVLYERWHMLDDRVHHPRIAE